MSTPVVDQAVITQVVRHPEIFLEFAQLIDEEPERPDWIVEGLVARGCVSELVAKVKCGKTHFALDMVEAVIAGRLFLGSKTTSVPVIYLTEEGATSFRSCTDRVGLRREARLTIVPRSRTRGLKWAEIGAEVTAMAGQVGAWLVVVDTLGEWASLIRDEENDAGAALAATRPLREMAEAGLAVLVLRHARKGGGEVADAARGSSAFDGAVDVILHLERMQAKGHNNRRKLSGVGRLDGIAAQLVVELEDNHYLAKGSESDVEYRDARAKVLDVMPDSREAALSEKAIIEQTQASRRTVQRVLKELGNTGVVQREMGAGEADKRGYGYWFIPPTP